jgi:hydrogenase maturation protease
MDEIHQGEIIILGMGNKFFGDDGVGIVIAEKLKELLADIPQIKVEETNWGGFRIIDLLSGYKSAIIVDALKTGKKPAGFIHKLDYKDLINSVRMVSFHDVNFATAVEFAREMNIPMPEEISVFAIEIKESDHFSEKLTGEVNAVVDKCVNLILDDISEQYGIEINHHEVIR